jgi:YidC/Oxa1 family membrane protein insertase
MNRLMLYVFPFGVVVGGIFLPLAIIFYWFSNNIWTFGQQHYVFGMMEKEDEAKKQEAIARRAANAPAPGAKPKRSPRAAATGGVVSAEAEDAPAEPAEPVSKAPDGQASETKANVQGEGPNVSGRTTNPGNRTPRPGARPKRRKR